MSTSNKLRQISKTISYVVSRWQSRADRGLPGTDMSSEDISKLKMHIETLDSIATSMDAREAQGWESFRKWVNTLENRRLARPMRTIKESAVEGSRSREEVRKAVQDVSRRNRPVPPWPMTRKEYEIFLTSYELYFGGCNDVDQ